MRLALVGLLFLSLAAAGCLGGPAGNPNLRPPCEESQPVFVEIIADKERYLPGELMNVTLVLNNSAAQSQRVAFRSWQLEMTTFDGKPIRTFFRDEGAGTGGANRTVAAGGRAVLMDRFQPFRVTQELFDPLPQGTYYLCVVVTGVGGSPVATGARPFIAEPPPRVPLGG